MSSSDKIMDMWQIEILANISSGKSYLVIACALKVSSVQSSFEFQSSI